MNVEEIFKENYASDFKKEKKRPQQGFLVVDAIRKFENPRDSPGWTWDQCLKG